MTSDNHDIGTDLTKLAVQEFACTGFNEVHVLLIHSDIPLHTFVRFKCCRLLALSRGEWDQT